MSDPTLRALERTWRTAPHDPALAHRFAEACWRSGQKVPLAALEQQHHPARTFDADLPMAVCALTLDGHETLVGWTPSPDGLGLQIPPHLRWWVELPRFQDRDPTPWIDELARLEVRNVAVNSLGLDVDHWVQLDGRVRLEQLHVSCTHVLSHSSFSVALGDHGLTLPHLTHLAWDVSAPTPGTRDPHPPGSVLKWVFARPRLSSLTLHGIRTAPLEGLSEIATSKLGRLEFMPRFASEVQEVTRASPSTELLLRLPWDVPDLGRALQRTESPVRLVLEPYREGPKYDTTPLNVPHHFADALPDTVRVLQLSVVHHPEHLDASEARSLDLRDTTSLQTLRTTPNLRELKLRFCTPSPEAWEEVSRLPHLAHLTLDRTPLPEDAARPFADLAELQSLTLRYAPRELLPFLADLSNLRVLNLDVRARGPLSEDLLEPLHGLPNLERLTISGHYYGLDVNAALAAWVSSLPALRDLTLDCHYPSLIEDPITPPALRHLRLHRIPKLALEPSLRAFRKALKPLHHLCQLTLPQTPTELQHRLASQHPGVLLTVDRGWGADGQRPTWRSWAWGSANDVNAPSDRDGPAP